MTSTNAKPNLAYADQTRNAKTAPDPTPAPVQLLSWAPHLASPVGHPAKELPVATMPSVELKIMKLIVSARMDGLMILRT